MSTGVQVSKAEREARIIARDFEPHEQQLFLRHRAGKSSHALAQVYRQYHGENDVREKLNELLARLGSAMSEQTGTGPAAAAAERAARDEEDDSSGGIPVRSVAAGTLNGGGAGGHSLPPTRPAPRPSVLPSAPVLDTQPASPARATRVAPGGRTDHERDAAVRDEKARVLLEAEPCSAAHIAEALGCSRGAIRKSLERMNRRGVAEPTGEATYDFTRSGAGGPPATAWRLVGDTRTVRFPAETHHPATAASRELIRARREKVLAVLMERPRTQRALCFDCEMRAPLMRTTLTGLADEGKARRTEYTAHDWQGSGKGRGRPSHVWEAIDGPAYAPPAIALSPARDPLPPVEIGEPEQEGVEIPDRDECGHGVPRNVCFTCQKADRLEHALGGLDRPSLEAELDEGRRRVETLEALLGAMDALAGSFA